jgi:hypothetical protein
MRPEIKALEDHRQPGADPLDLLPTLRMTLTQLIGFHANQLAMHQHITGRRCF